MDIIELVPRDDPKNKSQELQAEPLADPKYTSKEEKNGRDIYSGIDDIPSGLAGDTVTEGCVVLEGGGWRGLYTLGVLDAFMMNDLNIRNAVGISAGALSALGYIAGQIGWGAHIDLKYRHDSDYVGVGAMRRDHGVTGFSHLFTDLIEKEPIDRKRLGDPSRRLAVGVTNMITGKTEYMEKGRCNLSAAIRASATVPYVSRPVVINGTPYLDGGCSTKIPYPWAVSEGFDRIVVVKTREWDYRRKEDENRFVNRMYRNYPAFVDAMNAANADFNRMTDELFRLHAEKKVYTIAPSEPVKVSRFEGDMEKLGALYWLGFHDAERQVDAVRDYLS